MYSEALELDCNTFLSFLVFMYRYVSLLFMFSLTF